MLNLDGNKCSDRWWNFLGFIIICLNVLLALYTWSQVMDQPTYIDLPKIVPFFLKNQVTYTEEGDTTGSCFEFTGSKHSYPWNDGYQCRGSVLDTKMDMDADKCREECVK
jgi:hypothetical protein